LNLTSVSYRDLVLFSGFALECYVCDNQEDNKGKCVRTIKTCEYGEDVCLTEIRWGSTPYWQQGALKQYYVSKSAPPKINALITENQICRCAHIFGTRTGSVQNAAKGTDATIT
jgi:hypothetical protein